MTSLVKVKVNLVTTFSGLNIKKKSQIKTFKLY